MSVSVLDALTTEGFWGATILAGWSGLRRGIHGVTVAEVPDSANWLAGGEIVLTTAHIGQEDPDRFVRWAIALAQAGASAIAVKQQRFLGRIPETAIAELDRMGIPLIALRHRVSWPSIIGPVVHLEHASAGGPDMPLWKEELFQAIEERRGFPSIVTSLSDWLGLPVMVHGVGLELKAAGLPAEDSDVPEGGWHAFLRRRTSGRAVAQLRQDLWALMRRDPREPWTRQAYVVSGPDDFDELFLPLSHEEQIVGYVSHLQKKGTNEEDGAMWRYVAAVVSLAFRRFAWVGELQLSRAAAALLEALAGPREDAIPEALATILGAQGYLVAVKVDYRRSPSVLLAGDQPEVVDAFLRDLEGWAREWHADARVTYESGSYIFLNPLVAPQVSPDASTARPHDEQERWLTALRTFLETHYGVRDFQAGFSEVGSGAMFYRRALQECRKCLQLAESPAVSERVVWYDQLGVVRLMTSVDPTVVLGFVDPYRQALRDTEEGGSDLWETLETYFACDGNLTETAQRLFIHRNTLRYRLTQISERTGLDIRTSEGQATLYLTVRLAAFLSAGGIAHRP